MKIKVCGLTEPKNIQNLADLEIDYFGFIFYVPSPRYIFRNTPSNDMDQLVNFNNKVAVFVNEDEQVIRSFAENCKLLMRA